MQVIRLLFFGLSTFLLFQFVTFDLSWQKQAVLGGLSLLIAIAFNKSGKSQIITLAMMMLSLVATLRYCWWRIHLVMNFFKDESNNRVAVDSILMLILLSA